MALRKRISLAAAATVAFVMAVALVVCYDVVHSELFNQIDTELRAQEYRILSGDESLLTTNPRLATNPANEGGGAPYTQLADARGQSKTLTGDLTLPVSAAVRAVAAGRSSQVLYTTTVSNNDLRVIAFHAVFTLDSGGEASLAIQLARPIGPTASVLARLRLRLTLVFLAGILLAAILGRIAARRVLTPVTEMAATAQLIGETDDLDRRLVVRADDEVGQLADRFNRMLDNLAASRAALDESVRSQRQLVADASHELRTPVTSLRTNVEVLLEGAVLDEDDQRRLLLDVVEQSEELSTLVNDLIEVARGELPDEALEDLRLDQIVEASLTRARRNAPDVQFLARLAPAVVHGNAERLSRAVNNLLDNAALHGRGGPVEVTVSADTGVVVRDHGDGIAEEDMPHVFDRFYRGANSRATQGSGLGLAIVRQVAMLHDGSVTAANAADGGAVFTLRLPASEPATGGATPTAAV